MIYFPQTRGFISQEFPVAVGFTVTAEGQALVAVNGTDGSFGVKPSNADAAEQFLGLAVSQQMTITSKARVESFVIPAGLTVTVDRTPTGGTISVYNKTDGAVVATGGAGWTLTGKVFTLAAGFLGKTLEFYYKYAVTANESRQLQGDIFPGGAAGYVVNQVGILKNGVVFTDQFDTTVNWNVANPVVRTGVNGQLTIGGTGPIINCTVTQSPNADSAYLGLNLNY